MIIYPAIDIKSGSCVRLYQGSYDHVTQYENDPVIQAQSFAKHGAAFLHVVDLDGAKEGAPTNFEIICNIARKTKLPVQTGGGIRTVLQIREILANGISRVILGSIAVTQPTIVKEYLDEFGSEKIVLALDVRLNQQNQPLLAVQGWQDCSEKTLWDLLAEYQNSSLKHVICTDISRDGTLQGPNLDLYRECRLRFPHLAFQASGGISQLTDLSELASIPVAGVIVGKALYENKFSLPQAFQKLRKELC